MISEPSVRCRTATPPPQTFVLVKCGTGLVRATVARTDICGKASPIVRPILPDQAPGDLTLVERSVWTNCSAGVSVTLNKIVGGGHTWAGATPSSRAGRVSQELDANQEIWAFFMRHRRTN